MSAKKSVARLSRQLLYEQFAESVRRLIREDGLWGESLPSERELTRLYGVSHVTVRRGLELLASEGLIVRRHGQGTKVLGKPRRKSRAGAARIAVASISNISAEGYLAQIVNGLTQGAGDAGWSVNFFRRMGQAECQAAFFAALRAGEIDGLIMVGVIRREFVDEVLRNWNGPAVLVDHYFPDLPLTSVIDDSRDGARQATEHLLELGHRRIGYIDAPKREINPWRYEGYAAALRSAGIEPDDALVTRSPNRFEAGLKAGGELLALKDPPTAILAFCDKRAWGAWRAAEERGLEVGRDFAVVGYGDSEPGSPEALTSVAIDMQHLGQSAAAELAGQLAGNFERGRLVTEPARLVIRESTRAAVRSDTRAQGGSRG